MFQKLKPANIYRNGNNRADASRKIETILITSNSFVVRWCNKKGILGVYKREYQLTFTSWKNSEFFLLIWHSFQWTEGSNSNTSKKRTASEIHLYYIDQTRIIKKTKRKRKVLKIVTDEHHAQSHVNETLRLEGETLETSTGLWARDPEGIWRVIKQSHLTIYHSM